MVMLSPAKAILLNAVLAAATESDSPDNVALPEASDTLIDRPVVVPTVVGVPEIAPVEVEKDRPAGIVPVRAKVLVPEPLVAVGVNE
jgi:hypothetical protein